MSMLKSKGIVRRIIEDEGQTFVSFPNHSGYFQMPDDASLRAKIVESSEKKKEISFTYDKDLKILSVG